tara:strand:+ start:804 stop:1298 length:495 start_codon:yes stop_codon:yes gene_type:complete
MASTRFSNDEARIRNALQQSTDPGRWMLNVPGNGSTPDYIADPCIRIQKWGANLRHNAIDIESELRGVNRRHGSHCIEEEKNYHQYIRTSKVIDCPVNDTFYTEQSRAIAPAWTIREHANTQLQSTYLFSDPLRKSNIHMPFRTNVDTRNLEKDRCGTFKQNYN